MSIKESIFDKLVNNKKVLGLVKIMKPLDIAKVMARDFELCPREAAEATFDLVRHAEGMSSTGIETNKQFPVPPENKRDKPRFLNFKTKEENVMLKPATKVDISPKYVFFRHQFPPDPRGEVEDWPYDKSTIVGIDPKSKGKGRGLLR